MLADAFQGYLEGRDLSGSTIANYLSELRKFESWYSLTTGEDFSLDRLTGSDIRDYRSYLQVIGLKPSTVNRSMAALRCLAAWSGNTIRIRSIQSQPYSPKWLDRNQVNRLLREITYARSKSHNELWIRNQTIVEVLLNTGLRVSELINLRAGDIKISDRSGSMIVRSGKGNKTREIPLNAQCRDVLRTWLNANSFDKSERIFILTPRAVEYLLATLSKRTGLDITPHTLRHTFAKNLIDAGVTIDKVSSLLGHSSINTTMIYIIPGQRDLEKAVDLLA